MNEQKVEAVLFASGKFLSVEYIAEVTQLSKQVVKKALDKLQKAYDENKNSALKLFEEDGLWKMNVKEEYTEVVHGILAETEMSRAVMETLALVAYKSPVLQADIVKVKGSSAYDYIAELEKKGFITREKYQRSFKLKVTEKFHDYFDVKNPQGLFADVKLPEAILEEDPAKQEEEQKTILGSLRTLDKDIMKPDKEFLSRMDEKIAATKDHLDKSAAEELSNKEKMHEIFEATHHEGDKHAEGTVQETYEVQATTDPDKETDQQKETSNITSETEEQPEEQETTKEEQDEELLDDDPEAILEKVNKQIDALTNGK
ncbi:MAG: SMC-Scp complex subunit ScpB [Candidatus Woesearchaeota archaeon]|nr:MAG: SMC-Scp complex subunit ScpB [Candidatus Woesearchaeota archaeon]